MLDLPLSLQLLILTFLFPELPRVKAVTITNITIDDNDYSAISYSPGWTNSNSSNSLDYGGYHHLSNQESAFAEFHFTGVGVFFLSPLWPYSVKALLTLDEQAPPTLVDLQDYSRPFSPDGGSETVASEVVWGRQNLTAGNHSLLVQFAQGQGQYVVLDALMYTSIESNSSTQTTPFPLGSSALPTPSQSFAPSQAQTSSSPSQTSSSVSGIVGGVIGGVLSLVGIGLVFLYVRYRRPIMARFPRLFGINREDEESGHPDRNILLATPSAISHVSSNSLGHQTGSQGILRQPSQISHHYTPPSAATLSTPLLPLRPVLTPRVTHKELPDVPPEPVPKSPHLRPSKSIFRTLARAPPVVPVNTEPKSSQSGGSSSATSSFFPSPIHEEDKILLKKMPTGKSDVSGERDESRKKKAAGLGLQLFANESDAEESDNYPLFSSNYTMSQMGSRKISLSAVSPKTPRIQTAVPTRSSMAGSPLTPSSVSSLSAPTRKKGTVPPALDIIPEASSSRTSFFNSADSLRSSSRTKRRSGGAIRVEKEKMKRRHHRSIGSPQGPRTRISQRTPSPSVLVTPSTRTPVLSQVNTPTTPKTPRRRRPLPPSPQGPRRPSLSRGPHILVPLNAIRRSGAPVPATSPEILAVLRAHSSSNSNDNVDQRGESESESDMIHPRSPSSLSLIPMFPSPPPLPSPHKTQEPELIPMFPSPPPLPSPHKTQEPEKDPSSLKVPSIGLRPRSGQPEYVRSLPPVSSAADALSPSASSYNSPDGLPIAPHSAPLYTPGTASPRSPRRLPPLPVRNVRTPKSAPVAPQKDPLQSDSSAAQYAVVPSDLNVEPPPYSGLAFAETSFASKSTSRPTPSPPADKRVFEASSRRPLPRSVPITPTELSWTSNSTKQMLASMIPNEGSVDSTAANLLMDLLNDTASIASYSSTAMGPSLRRVTSLGSSVIPNETPKNDRGTTKPPPIVSTTPASTLPLRISGKQDRVSKPLLSPSPSLSIPPLPSAPPPPVPILPPRQRRRGKVWDANGVNIRTKSSAPSISSSSSHTG